MTRPPFPRVVDSTLRASFVACPHKFYREYLQHWKPLRESVHLVAGAAFAKGIEVTRLSYYGAGNPPDVALGEGLAALIREYGEFDTEDSGSAKTIENMCGALSEYFTVHPLASDPVVPHMVGGQPAVEFSFALPLDIMNPETGDPILYAGRFDMLGIYNEALFAVDEKTASQLGAQWQKNWTLRSQLTGYCWAAREYGYPVAGAIIRGISILKNGYGNAESIQYRPQWQIDRWYQQLHRDLSRMVEAWKENYWDYNLDSSCSSYGGCPFLDICNSNDPERWLAADFVQREWSPLANHKVPSA